MAKKCGFFGKLFGTCGKGRMGKEYQGHKSWNQWNVSLWISNDEGLYNLAKWAWERSKKIGKSKGHKGNARIAARIFIDDIGIQSTPDGGKYNITSVAEAIKGLELE